MQKVVIGTTAMALAAIAIGQMPDGRGDDRPNTLSDPEINPAMDSSFEGAAPDVVLWSIQGSASWSESGFRAYSVGTTSCNLGNVPLIWNGSNNQHPVIAQNMFRVTEGRVEQIGQGWLKHGFCALDQTACGPCPNGTGCASLAPDCSDPYTASRNGSQGSAGPKYQVNATTGFFPYPPANPSYSGSTARRVRVANDDVNASLHPGARYFMEGQYVHPEDSVVDAGDSSNNASYREISLGSTGAWGGGYVGSTAIGQPGIYAWKAVNPDVTIVHELIPGEGNYYLGYLVTDNGDGSWTYEYALQNLDSDRSVGIVSVPVPTGVNVGNIGFHDVDYHSGEPYSGTDWSSQLGGGALRWSTQAYNSNPNANALRWGTLYNFRFTTDTPPVGGELFMGMFKPGTPSSFTVGALVPDTGTAAISFDYPDGIPTNIDPAGDSITVQITENVAGGLIGGTAVMKFDSGSGFVDVPLTPLGGDLYAAATPAVDCGTTVNYYFAADTNEGVTRVDPLGAPSANYESFAALGETVVFSDDAETNPGWTVTNDPGLADGPWGRGDPVGGGDRGDPADDGDGSGQCWLTDNVDDNSDVDGGPTILTSPAFNLDGLENVVLDYLWWHNCDDAGTVDEDVLTVQISNNNGGSWSQLVVHESASSWQSYSVQLDSVIALTSTVRVRFISNDSPNNSVTESAIDGISIRSLVCSEDNPCPADIDGSGSVEFNDIVALLAAWGPCSGCPADVDENGNVNFDDLVTVLAAWGACP